MFDANICSEMHDLSVVGMYQHSMMPGENKDYNDIGSVFVMYRKSVKKYKVVPVLN
jgi:hypothetical protein